MKKFIPTLTLTALTLSGAAQASGPTLQFSQHETPYRTLQKAFADGEDAVMEELEGYHSGRCFETWDQDKPLNSMLVSHLLTSQAGPLFPAEELLFVYQNDPYSADYFDGYALNDDNENWNIQTIRRSLNGAKFELDTSTGSPELGKDYEPNGRMDEVTSFRWVGEYIVSQKVNLISNNIIKSRASISRDNSGWGHPGNVAKEIRNVPAGPIEYCYYFKKIEKPADEK